MFHSRPFLSITCIFEKNEIIYYILNYYIAILPSTDVVNNLWVYFDSDRLMERQVSRLCQVCYFHLRRIRTIRQSLTEKSLLTLVLHKSDRPL